MFRLILSIRRYLIHLSRAVANNACNGRLNCHSNGHCCDLRLMKSGLGKALRELTLWLSVLEERMRTKSKIDERGYPLSRFKLLGGLKIPTPSSFSLPMTPLSNPTARSRRYVMYRHITLDNVTPTSIHGTIL